MFGMIADSLLRCKGEIEKTVLLVKRKMRWGKGHFPVAICRVLWYNNRVQINAQLAAIT